MERNKEEMGICICRSCLKDYVRQIIDDEFLYLAPEWIVEDDFGWLLPKGLTKEELKQIGKALQIAVGQAEVPDELIDLARKAVEKAVEEEDLTIEGDMAITDISFDMFMHIIAGDDEFYKAHRNFLLEHLKEVLEKFPK